MRSILFLFILAGVCVQYSCKGPGKINTEPEVGTVSSEQNESLVGVDEELLYLSDKYKTGKESRFLSKREKAMVSEINFVRSNPREYVSVVEAYILRLEEQKLKDQDDAYYDQEIEAAYELIKFLKKTVPVSVLQPHKSLYLSAMKHGDDMQFMERSGHEGSDGSMPWDRILRESPDFFDGNENLIGGNASVRESVLMLLVDAGVKDKGHRMNILNPDWDYVACCEVGTVEDYPYFWVQDFAQDRSGVVSVKTIDKKGFSLSDPPGENPQVKVVDKTLMYDTGKNASYLSNREREVIKAINTLRGNPQNYLNWLRTEIEALEKKKFEIGGSSFIESDIREANALVTMLEEMEPLPPLNPDIGLYNSGFNYVELLKRNRQYSLDAEEGVTSLDRIKRYAPQVKEGAEILTDGSYNIDEMVKKLIWNKDALESGTREAIFSKEFDKINAIDAGFVSNKNYVWMISLGSTGQASNRTSGGQASAKSDRKSNAYTPVFFGHNSDDAVSGADADGKLVFKAGGKEYEMIKMINMLRRDPQSLIPDLTGYLSLMETQKRKGGGAEIREKIEATLELIEELESMPPMEVLTFNKSLYKSSVLYSQQQQERGYWADVDTDGDYPWDRILKEVPGLEDANEHFISGVANGKYALMDILIDTDNINRIRRNLILGRDWTYISCHYVEEIGKNQHFWIQSFGK